QRSPYRGAEGVSEGKRRDQLPGGGNRNVQIPGQRGQQARDHKRFRTDHEHSRRQQQNAVIHHDGLLSAGGNAAILLPSFRVSASASPGMTVLFSANSPYRFFVNKMYYFTIIKSTQI